MTTLLIFIHVAAAVLLLGPVMVSTSMFPGQASAARAGGPEEKGRASILHKITNRYGLLSLLVPLLGVVVMAANWDAYSTNYWLHTAIIISVIAWAILFFMVIPQQRKIMGNLGVLDPAEGDAQDTTSDFEGAKAKAAAGAGLFNLLWFVVLILMFLPHPDSM
ncbi:DUF2269 domain-containing protein [Corynebacterium auris]|uniref:DUF2269 domain-containing protein n=1 Tax=Corynebacterium auris TaxID=44750 RepID=UPI0025B46C25|nr:DUF2269 domain-containing protein [Corynebacterium auris]WJY67796.1 hypothetical protein CAURIS_04400 [Corynebacterium auris]